MNCSISSYAGSPWTKTSATISFISGVYGDLALIIVEFVKVLGIGHSSSDSIIYFDITYQLNLFIYFIFFYIDYYMTESKPPLTILLDDDSFPDSLSDPEDCEIDEECQLTYLVQQQFLLKKKLELEKDTMKKKKYRKAKEQLREIDHKILELTYVAFHEEAAVKMQQEKMKSKMLEGICMKQ